MPTASQSAQIFEELLAVELEYRHQLADHPSQDEYLERFPQYSDAISRGFARFAQKAETLVSGDPTAPDSVKLPPERYQREHVHGEGGLGRVWSAYDQRLGRVVAIKELSPRWSGHRELRQRFSREALITAQLSHPNIVPVYEYQEDDDGSYYVMKLVAGRTLRDAIDEYHQVRAAQGPQRGTLVKLIRALVGVCQAVAFAHTKGVIHRDLKPDNVILGEYGEVIVLDWGLAKQTPNLDQPEGDSTSAPAEPVPNSASTDRTGSTPEVTAAGQVLGTPAFMSPEQARGDEIGPAADVFGLGATLYMLLTGVPPYRGEDQVATLQLAVDGKPDPPRAVVPNVSRALESICCKAIAHDADDRYQHVNELIEDLEAWVADTPISAHRESWLDRATRLVRRHRAWALAGSVAMVLLTISSIVASVLIEGARERESTAKKNAVAESKKSQRLLYDVRAGANEQARQLTHRNVMLAFEYWQNNQVEIAQQLLQECDTRYRSWEWQYCWNLTQLPAIVAQAPSNHTFAGAGFDHQHVPFVIVDNQEDQRAERMMADASETMFRPYMTEQAEKLDAEDRAKVERAVNKTIGRFKREPIRQAFRRLQLGEKPVAKELGTHLLDMFITLPDPYVFQLPYAGQRFNWQGQRAVFWEHNEEGGRTQFVSLVEGEEDYSIDGVGVPLAWSRDGERVLLYSWDNQATVWNWAAREATSTSDETAGPHGQICGVFTYDAKSYALAFADRLELRDAQTGDLTTITRDGESMAAVWPVNHGIRQMTFSPDGKHLAAVTADGSLVLFDTTNGSMLPAQGRENGVLCGIAFSPDGTRIATGGDSGYVRLFNVADLSHVYSFRGAPHSPVSTLAFSSDGKQLIGAGLNTVMVWNLPGALNVQGTSQKVSEFAINVLAVTQNGRTSAVSGYVAGKVKDTDFERQDTRIRLLRSGDASYTWKEKLLTDHEHVVQDLDFHPTRPWLASASADATVKVWNAETGALHKSLEQHQQSLNCVAFSADGDYLAAAEGGWTKGNPVEFKLGLWQLPNFDGHRELGGHLAPISCLEFSKTGNTLYSGDVSGTVCVWDVARGTMQSRLEIFPQYDPSNALQARGILGRMAVSPDDKFIVFPAPENTTTLLVWSVRRDALVAKLVGHTHQVIDLAFTPDGQRLVSISSGMMMRFWETKTWRETFRYRGWELSNRLQFAESGKTIFFATDKGSLSQLSISPQKTRHVELR